jgi:protein O-mannosyl-transferase
MAAKQRQQNNRQGKPRQQQAQSPKREAARNDPNRIYWFLTTVVLTLIAFFPAFKNEFTNWDDSGYIVDNVLIRSLSAENIGEIFSTYVQGNYHPLTVLSNALEYRFFELSPWIYHFNNILLHILNSILVLIFINRLTGRIEIAGITAILFGIHPMHVESVAWVSERKDVLYTFFFLASLICYMIYRKSASKKYYVFSLLLFLLSLLSKGQAVVLPLVFLLVDFYMGREKKWSLLTEKIPFFALSLIFGVVAVIAQKSSDAIQSSQLFTFFERICFASYGMLMYLVKLVIPYKLSCFYPYPFKTNNLLPFYFYICPLIAGLVFLAVYRTLRYTRVAAFGFLFFLVTIVLVLQLLAVGSTIMSDRYSYVPYIGIFFIIGSAYDYIARHRRQFRTVIAGLLVAWSLMLIVVARKQCMVWRNSLSLWNNVIEKYPMVPVAHNNKALVYKNEGKYDLALQGYNKALEVDPTYQGSYENRGNIYFLTGRYEEAIVDFNKALSLKENSEVAFNSRGAVYFNQGKYDLALADFNRAIESKPDYPEAYRNRGNVYSVLGQFDKAAEDYTTYLKFDQRLEMVWFWRGIAYINLRKYREAVDDITRAIGMKPQVADFYVKRSQAYMGLGDFGNALADAENAKLLGGSVDEAYLNDLRSRVSK